MAGAYIKFDQPPLPTQDLVHGSVRGSMSCRISLGPLRAAINIQGLQTDNMAEMNRQINNALTYTIDKRMGHI